MPDTPPVLTNEIQNAIKDFRAHWVVPGYCAGVMLMGLAYDAVAYPLAAHHFTDSFSQLIYGLILPPAFAFVSLLPQIISLGLSLWLKRKIIKEVRFGGFRPALFWGIAGGLFPWPLFPLFQDTGVFQTVFWFGAMAWFLSFPVIAGTFLCYRVHLRD